MRVLKLMKNISLKLGVRSRITAKQIAKMSYKEKLAYSEYLSKFKYDKLSDVERTFFVDEAVDNSDSSNDSKNDSNSDSDSDSGSD